MKDEQVCQAAGAVDVVKVEHGADPRTEVLLVESATTLPATLLISRLPTERMASDWATIAETLRNKENGRETSSDLVLRPGGVVDKVSSAAVEQYAEPVSTLPSERMAAGMPGPSSADIAEIRRLDPTNRENWTPTYRGDFSGWTFELSPPVRTQCRFRFLTFRSPSDGNRLRTSPLYPSRDHLFGHAAHMINVRVGGFAVPVICGPSGRSAANFTQVRGDAAKWMIYTSYQLAGLPVPFSA
jgi:hypothetical protein